jgi:hypothetical protein
MECFQFHLCKSIKLVFFFLLFAVINLLFYTRIIRLWVSNATFKKYWLIKTEYSDKTVNLIQVTDTLYHIRLYRVHLVIRGHQVNNFHENNRLITANSKKKNTSFMLLHKWNWKHSIYFRSKGWNNGGYFVTYLLLTRYYLKKIPQLYFYRWNCLCWSSKMWRILWN